MQYSVVHLTYSFTEEWEQDLLEQALCDIGFEVFDEANAYIQTAVLEENQEALEALIAETDGAEIVGADGTILGSYYTATPASNIIRITGNLIAENIIEFGEILNSIPPVYGTYNDLAEEILANANKVQSFYSAKVNLFPFRAPY